MPKEGTQPTDALPMTGCRSTAASRLHLYFCRQEHAQITVGMLMRLSQLTAVSLGVHGCSDCELSGNYPSVEDWDSFLLLPRVASVTALTELRLVGIAALPPDLRQLSQLRRLAVVGACDEDWGPFQWGTDSLAGLASLTCVKALSPPWYRFRLSLPGESRWPEQHACMLIPELAIPLPQLHPTLQT